MKFQIQSERNGQPISFIGEFKRETPVAVVGPSGAGKTTLLRYLAGFERDGTVDIQIDGKLLSQPWRSGVCLLHQQPVLFAHHTVQQTFDFAAQFRAGKRVQAITHHRLITEWIDQLDIGPLLHKPCTELSGGQAQRVVLLRALISEPSWLMLDEAFSALDEPLQRTACEVVAQFIEHSGAGLVVASHQRLPLFHLCDAVYSVGELKGSKVYPISDALNQHQSSAWAGEVLTQQTLMSANALEVVGEFLAFDVEGERLFGYLPSQWHQGSARLSINANEVSLAIGERRQSTMVNRIAGRIQTIQAEQGDQFLVSVAVGAQCLQARVSGWSLRELSLNVGLLVFAEFKVGAVVWQGQRELRFS